MAEIVRTPVGKRLEHFSTTQFHSLVARLVRSSASPGARRVPSRRVATAGCRRRHCCHRRHRRAMSTAHATAAAVLAVASLALVLRKRAQASAPVQCTPCEANDREETSGPGKKLKPLRILIRAEEEAEVSSDPRPVASGSGATGRPGSDPRHHLNRRFFADTDAAGLVRCDLRLVDRFLSLDCGHELLRLGLFPNAQEISDPNPDSHPDPDH